MKVKQFVFNHFQTNCYVVWDEEAKVCAIIDPASEAGYEDVQLAQFVDSNGLKVVKILLTHAHVDHVAGLREACERFRLPVTLHRDGVKLLRQAEAYGVVSFPRRRTFHSGKSLARRANASMSSFWFFTRFSAAAG